MTNVLESHKLNFDHSFDHVTEVLDLLEIVTSTNVRLSMVLRSGPGGGNPNFEVYGTKDACDEFRTLLIKQKGNDDEDHVVLI